MKKWKVEATKSPENLDELIDALLKNRGISSKKEIEDFLNPSLESISLKTVDLDVKRVKNAVSRVKKAIEKKEKIIIFGDYDVDGVCASAIVWETLNSLKADVMPYIPSRFDEGYGLSKVGIDNLLKEREVNLIITVDNGIVANEAVSYAKEKGIDVIITDHHAKSEKLPDAYEIVHTVSLCGAGVAYVFSKEILGEKISEKDDHLSLVVLATVADLVPLLNSNRVLATFGLKALRKTKRPGLLALFDKARIKKEEIDIYHIGHIIAPRLNAMGRLLSAMDSLRLICTTDKKRAEKLSFTLNDTNFQRQQITTEVLNHAQNRVKEEKLKNLIFIADESYQQGIIGLVAGRLVEEYYLPTIVISKGQLYSKASARSVKGFNITEFLRSASDLLVDVGGHPMAAGFTVETKKLDLLKKKLFESAKESIKPEYLERTLRIDTEINGQLINIKTLEKLKMFAPFGMANPEPTFLTKGLNVVAVKTVGKDGKHLKIKLGIGDKFMDGIAFSMESTRCKVGDQVDAVFVIDDNTWNGNTSLQLNIKDIRSA